MSNFHYRILVVDDDERIRQVSDAILSHCGYEVRTAEDGFDALALMRKALPDLIISDLKMPNMSGFELLSVVRRRFPQIPVIAISGAFVRLGSEQGLIADAFFHKGEYSPEELFKEIQSLLERAPIRHYFAKPEKTPVWIPRNGDYYMLTCGECLRSFSVPSTEPSDVARELSCVFCDSKVRFILEGKKP
jgi:CheY-like chemotaxis protein